MIWSVERRARRQRLPTMASRAARASAERASGPVAPTQRHPLAIPLDEEQNYICDAFFHKTPNRLADYLDTDELMLKTLKVIHVEDYRANHQIRLQMNDDESRAVAYLVQDNS